MLFNDIKFMSCAEAVGYLSQKVTTCIFFALKISNIAKKIKIHVSLCIKIKEMQGYPHWRRKIKNFTKKFST